MAKTTSRHSVFNCVAPLHAKKTRNAGRWTEARWRGFVVSALRAASRRWPPKSDVLKSARAGHVMSVRLKRMVNAYRCELCTKQFTSTYMRVDHKAPVVDPKKGWASFDTFIKRLFCEAEGLQAVCIECHKTKTDKERQVRNEQRRLTKTKHT